MQHEVSKLEGALLDFAVARAERHVTQWRDDEDVVGRAIHTNDSIGAPLGRIGDGEQRYAPSTDWAQGGPIIERESIAIERVAYSDSSLREWGAAVAVGSEHPEDWKRWHGPTPLVAAMRAYVASQFGETVDLP